MLNINKVDVSEVNQLVLLMSASTISSMIKVNISNWTKAIELTQMSTLSIYNSTFVNLGSAEQYNGAGLQIEDSNLTISRSSFENNSAQNGGAIYLSWKLKLFCSYNISFSSFKNNSAIYQGGAIYYDLFRPQLSENLYENNFAGYGPNIASYPIKIKIKDNNSDYIRLYDVGSGVKYSSSLELALVDYDDQVNRLDNSSVIAIKSARLNTSVSGSTLKKVEQGFALFSDLVFLSSPGKTNVEYSVSSEAIDSQKIMKTMNNFTQNPIQVWFRFWMPGEIIENDKCVTCSSGTYSFIWNSTKWESCMPNSNCLGGIYAYADSGYWRLDKNSTSFYECMNPKACIGGFNENSTHPINWATGYEGVMCAKWIVNNDNKYENTGEYKWSKWPDPVLNIIRVIGLMILAILFFIIQIIIILRKREESQSAILMRILTNYLQVISAVLSFNIKFPSTLSDIFLPIGQLGSTSEPFISFDWFVRNQNLQVFTPSTSIFKVFLSAILPFATFIITVVVWLVLNLILKWRLNLKRNILVSNIVILFILHPTITKSFLSLFQWVKISPNESRVKIAVDIVWYSNEHSFWFGLLSIPSIIIWSAGIPMFAFYLLFKNRHNLNDIEIKRYYLMLYQGLKEDWFYWEFINTVRKLVILWMNSLLSTFSLFFRLLPLTLMFTMFFRLQLRYCLRFN